MVVSERYNFIFVHIPKNGGQSIRTKLRDHVEISTLHTHEGVRLQFHAHLSISEIGNALNNYTFSNTGLNPQKLDTPIERFEGKKIYTVVRNTWDRIVSFHKFISRTPEHPKYDWVRSISFEDFVYSGYVIPQHHYLWDFVKQCIWDDINILRFENLQEDFNNMCRDVGLHQIQLPHLHKSKVLHYSEYYSEELASWVHRKYLAEIKAFNFRFDDRSDKIGK